MMKFKYHFLKLVFWLLSKIPFWFYHGLSTFIAFVFIKTKIYRYHVVFDNLRKSFPNKSEKEIKRIAHQFYYHFADLLIESVKAFGFSEKDIQKRYKFNQNPDVQKLLDEKRNIALILPHYANWEWAAQGTNFLTKQNQPLVLIMYKSLKNKVMDKLMKDNRTRFPGNHLFPKDTVMREVVAHQDEHYLLGFASDQAPANVYNSYWMDFLG